MNNELYYNTFWVNIYAEAFEIISFVYSGNILFINRGAVDNKSIDKLLWEITSQLKDYWFMQM